MFCRLILKQNVVCLVKSSFDIIETTEKKLFISLFQLDKELSTKTLESHFFEITVDNKQFLKYF